MGLHSRWIRAYVIADRENPIGGAGPEGGRGRCMFREMWVNGPYSCIQEKNLHIGMPIGNSVRIARDRPAQIPLLLYHAAHDLSIPNFNEKSLDFL